MDFIVYGKPQGKQRARVTMVGGFAKAYTPEQTVSYENLIKLSFRKAVNEATSDTVEMSDIQATSFMADKEPLELILMAVYPIPKSFSKKKMEQAIKDEIRPTTKPDLDNVIKVVCDALNGVAYRDDTQIVQILASKSYGTEPRLEIAIHKLSELKGGK